MKDNIKVIPCYCRAYPIFSTHIAKTQLQPHILKTCIFGLDLAHSRNISDL